MKIERQANNDFLTGLYNRMCCERDLLRIVDEAKECGGKGAVIYLDLDDFKHINDGLGHQYGDMLLKAIGTNLRHIRGIENTCYRVGGDEFVLVLQNDDLKKCEELKKLFIEKSAEITAFAKEPWEKICVAIGIAIYDPKVDKTVEDVFNRADRLMYENKHQRKSWVRQSPLRYDIKSTNDKRKNRLDCHKI